MDTSTGSVQRPQESPRKHIHIGSLIEQRLEKTGMTKAEFARRIGTSRQNVTSLLKKQSLDTALLHRIGGALDHNFFNDLADFPVLDSAQAGQVKGADKQRKLLAASLDAQAAISRLNVLLAGGA